MKNTINQETTTATTDNKVEVGAVFTTNQNCKLKVKEYHSAKKVVVKFLDDHGAERTTSAKSIRKGAVKNPYHPSVFNIGYMGDGSYCAKIKGKATPQYRAWKAMMARCYDPITQKNQPTYVGCTVVNEWHNFQTFASWYDAQPCCYDEDGGQFAVDKDLLQAGNKHYSPANCNLIPRELNNLFSYENRASERGLPVGVSKRDDVYMANISINNKSTRIGTFDTVEQARQAYNEAKAKYVKEKADKWADKMTPQAYDAVINRQRKLASDEKVRVNAGSVVKVGDTHVSKQGCRYSIIEVQSANKVAIKFNDKYGAVRVVRASQVRANNITNPNYPTVKGVGYIGVGEYEAYLPKKRRYIASLCNVEGYAYPLL